MLTTSSDVLLVLGLPQCGTNGVSHVLSRCGAQNAPVSKLSKAQQSLLSAAGNGWNSPLELGDRFLNSPEAGEFSKVLKSTLENVGANPCAIACVHGMERVLPLWQKALVEQECRVRHVLVVRHPLAVVEQFRQSEGWDRDHALLVWLQSALAMERHSRKHSRVVVDGEQIEWDLDGALNQIEDTLQLSLPNRHHKTLIEIESNREISQNTLIHPLGPSNRSDAGSILLSMAIQLHHWLLEETSNTEINSQLPTAIRQQLLLADSLMGRTLSDLSIQKNSLQMELKSLRKSRYQRLMTWFHRERSQAA